MHPICEREYVEFCMCYLGKSQDQLLKEANLLRTHIQNIEIRIKGDLGHSSTKKIRKRIGRNKTELTRLHGLLNRVEAEDASQALAREMYKDQWHRIHNVPQVESIQFRGKSLVILTHPLFGKSTDSQWHRVGPFLISILLSGDRNQMHWINLEGAVKDMQAPAGVQLSGAVGCIGNAGPPLIDAFKRHDHVQLVEIAVRYAECSGQHDNLRLWPQVSPDDVPEWYIQTFGR